MADSSSTSVTLGQSAGVTADGTTIANTGGTISVKDPLVPADGTQNITGALTVSAGVISNGISFPASGGPFGMSNTYLSVGVGGGGSNITAANGSSVNLTGNSADGAAALGVVIDNNAALSNATAKLLSVRNNATEKLAVSTAGAITPSADVSGAVKLLWVGRGTYVIDFGAFTAGIDQTSAQTLTGVAFGDCLIVGCSIDQSASIGTMTAMVTSAGNIVITVSPVSTTSTANPASATYTVTAIRTA